MKNSCTQYNYTVARGSFDQPVENIIPTLEGRELISTETYHEETSCVGGSQTCAKFVSADVLADAQVAQKWAIRLIAYIQLPDFVGRHWAKAPLRKKQSKKY